MNHFPMVRPTCALMLLTLLVAGCINSQPALVSEDDVPTLSRLKCEAAALPNRVVRVDTGQTGLHVAVHEIGQEHADRVIVLVHGLVSDSGVWRFCTGPLAEQCDVMAVDLPGCGQSDAPSPRDALSLYRPESLCRAVLLALRRRLREHNPGARLTLAGHSLGGSLILRMLSDRHIRDEFADVLDRVDGVVLFTPVDVAIEKDQPLFHDLVELSGAKVAIADTLGILPHVAAQSAIDGVVAPAPALREEAERTLSILRDPPRREAMRAIIRQAVPRDHERPDWSRIEPLVADDARVSERCLIVWGARDEVFPLSMGYKLSAELPHARLQIVPAAMHSLPIERPEMCVRLMLDFADRPVVVGALQRRTDFLSK